jgi:hypothetical protein
MIKSTADQGHRPILHAHHPDRLRWPAAGAEADRLRQALVWNVFRTLALLPPAFWLRRLQARVGGAGTPDPTAQLMSIRLWQPLPLPPAQRLADAAGSDATADIVIETEHSVWTLGVSGDDGLSWLEGDGPAGGRVARLVEAGSWLAGQRHCHCGLIVWDREHAAPARALVRRFARSRQSVSLQSSARAGSLANARGIGLLGWPDLAAILQDCARASACTDIERALARRTLAWLADVGVAPAADGVRADLPA